MVADLDDVAVRTGDKRISELPNAVASYGQMIGIPGARESMLFLDYDGTLSPIVSDPAAATLVDGAAEALELVAAVCPVAILSGRDLADIRSRVGIPGIWYAGSHGFELTGPDGTYHRERSGRRVRTRPRARGRRIEPTSLAADSRSSRRTQALRRRGALPRGRAGTCR